MNSADATEGFRVALVSTPWPLFNRPSIQLGTLKAYIAREFAAVRVSTYHFYLKVAEKIGYGLYQALCERTWIAESVYAALLYPERFERIEALFKKSAGRCELAGVDFSKLVTTVGMISESLVNAVAWRRFQLVGFSLSLCQLTSSLYFIRQVRNAAPDAFIVVGGSTFSGDAARKLAAGFPEIDAVVQGEGELPLAAILKQLLGNVGFTISPPGVVTRHCAASTAEANFNQLPRLEALPIPDYNDFFACLQSLPSVKQFFPTLPVEISRGCWWRRPAGLDGLPGCAFCNLNLQWEGYRSKSSVQVAAEVDRLSRRHQVLSLAFVDNALPAKKVNRIFKSLAELGKDFKFFAEIRAGFSNASLTVMAAAGVDEVQVGIEALSTDLLQRLNKGTSAIENLEVMKNCEALGIKNQSNLILHFPGSDQQHVDQTLNALAFAGYFRPLRAVGFWLGYGSPVWASPQAYGIYAVGNHHYYAVLFPRKIVRQQVFTIQSYRGDLVRQRRLWRPVKRQLSKWAQTYRALHAAGQEGPILSFRDGGDFIIIRQRRVAKKPMMHRLTGVSRQVYLFCQQRRSVGSVLSRFPQLKEDQLLPFLNMMVSKKLMFREKDHYLSLAVAQKAFRSVRRQALVDSPKP